jgi:hypothetical protein
MTSQRTSGMRRQCKASSSFPKLTSNGLDVHLAALTSFQNESRRVQFEQLVDADLQYAFSSPAAIERGCSIEANHAQDRWLTRLDKPRVAIAKLRIIRAHFNKRTTPAFPKSGSCSDRLARWRIINEDALALDNCNRLLCGLGRCRAGAIRLRWLLGSHVRDATGRVRSHLQLQGQCF